MADRAGLDLANLAVDLSDAVAPSRLRLTYAWTFGDIKGLQPAIKQEGIAPAEALTWAGRTAWAALRADVHLTWSWRDPLPTLVTYWRRLALPAWRRVAARRSSTARRFAGRR